LKQGLFKKKSKLILGVGTLLESKTFHLKKLKNDCDRTLALSEKMLIKVQIDLLIHLAAKV